MKLAEKLRDGRTQERSELDYLIYNAPLEYVALESIGDIAFVMKNKKKLSKMRWRIVLTGIPVTVLLWIILG